MSESRSKDILEFAPPLAVPQGQPQGQPQELDLNQIEADMIGPKPLDIMMILDHVRYLRELIRYGQVINDLESQTMNMVQSLNTIEDTLNRRG